MFKKTKRSALLNVVAANRPGRPKELNRYKLQIHHPADLVNQMRLLAKRQGVNIGTLYTMAARDYLSNFTDDLKTL